jgi:hypothetical protein
MEACNVDRRLDSWKAVETRKDGFAVAHVTAIQVRPELREFDRSLQANVLILLPGTTALRDGETSYARHTGETGAFALNGMSDLKYVLSDLNKI